jgi:PadR family transcriptional regulator PadR
MPRLPNVSSQTRSLLKALAAEPQTWRHGYALAKLTGLKSGTLYPLLIRLEAQGLLASQWQAVQQQGRPPRHLYRLTSAGMALARERERVVRIAPHSPSRLKEKPA